MHYIDRTLGDLANQLNYTSPRLGGCYIQHGVTSQFKWARMLGPNKIYAYIDPVRQAPMWDSQGVVVQIEEHLLRIYKDTVYSHPYIDLIDDSGIFWLSVQKIL
jgi:hypothetical protein